MLSPQEQYLLRRYYAQMLDKEETLLLIKKIIENGGYNTFAQTLKLQNTVEQIIRQHEVMQARIIAEKLDIDLSVEAPIPDIDDTQSATDNVYSLADLLAMFEPAAEWEGVTTTRSYADSMSNMQGIVVLPENGIFCKQEDSLYFDLERPIASSLECKIYNNQQEMLIQQQIPSNTVSFAVNLQLPPGRYYWELASTDRQIKRQLEAASGWFLVAPWLLDLQQK